MSVRRAPRCLRRPWPLAAAAALLACACGPSAPALVDATARARVDFRHESGFRETYCFPETMGSGAALVDLDGDGDVDLYALQGGVVPGSPAEELAVGPPPTNRLYLNDGRGVFADATAASGAAAHASYAMGVCAGDVDGDGGADLFVTNYGPDALFVNRGAARFDELAAGTPLADPRWNTACGFADLDRDGNLDLVVVGYVVAGPVVMQPCVVDGSPDYCDVAQYEGVDDRVWRGDGRGGFEERSAEWGLAGKVGKGLGLALVDLDDDGDVDLYVANDSVENHVFLNRGDGSLEDVTYLSGAAYSVSGKPEAGMGVAVADVDGNALPDLLVTNFAGESNALYANAGRGRFRDRSRPAGITALSRTPLGFGVAFADLDRDGLEDLVVTNGHVLRHVERRFELWTYAQPAQLFRGLEGGRFEPWDAGPALARPRVGRGLACGDLDGDGDPDLVLTGSDERLLVLENRLAQPGSHGLRVRLVGRGTNTLAVGARVRLVLAGAPAQVRWVRSGTGYLSQDDLCPLFGFPAGARALRVEVRWPDGTETVHALDGGDRTLTVEEPTSSARPR